VCSTISTAYVHGGRSGVLPEVAVNSAAPPSLFCPLVPSKGQNGNGCLAGDSASESTTAVHSNGTANGSAEAICTGNGHANGNGYTNGHSRHSSNGYSNGTTNGHTNGHSRNGSMNGHSRHASSNGFASQQHSIPGTYLDLESELEFARVSCCFVPYLGFAAAFIWVPCHLLLLSMTAHTCRESMEEECIM
jgi:hypothetical protein